MSEPPSAFQRLVTMAMLGAELDKWRQQEAFDEAVRDAYKDPAVTEPIVKAVAEAIFKATHNAEVLVNVTLGSEPEWVIAARSTKDILGSEMVLGEKETTATWEFKNGSAVCIRCKTEPPKGV